MYRKENAVPFRILIPFREMEFHFGFSADPIPSYVRKLEGVNENKDAREYSREATIKKFSEEERMSYHNESFRHISLAGENIRTISEKKINSFNDKTCTHCSG